MFCGRLAETAAGDAVTHIEIALAPTEGRSLFSDFPLRHIYPGYKADVDRIFLTYELPRVELLARVAFANGSRRNKIGSALVNG
jgi:hypothetical protein